MRVLFSECVVYKAEEQRGCYAEGVKYSEGEAR